MRTTLLTIGFLLALGAKGAAAKEERVADGKTQVHRRADGRLVYVAPPVIVEGKVQRPEALFVLPRPKISYEWPELKRDLLPQVARDAERAPPR